MKHIHVDVFNAGWLVCVIAVKDPNKIYNYRVLNSDRLQNRDSWVFGKHRFTISLKSTIKYSNSIWL